jgi:chaperonin GroES
VRVKLQPLYDRVVLREVPADTTTPSGLFLPEAAAPDVLEGEVTAVGEGTPVDYYPGEWSGFRLPRVAPGDRVLFHPLTGRTVTLDGVDYRVLRESEIIAKLVAE